MLYNDVCASGEKREAPQRADRAGLEEEKCFQNTSKVSFSVYFLPYISVASTSAR